MDGGRREGGEGGRGERGLVAENLTGWPSSTLNAPFRTSAMVDELYALATCTLLETTRSDNPAIQRLRREITLAAPLPLPLPLLLLMVLVPFPCGMIVFRQKLRTGKK